MFVTANLFDGTEVECGEVCVYISIHNCGQQWTHDFSTVHKVDLQ
jgi:hypothetical protein